MSLAADSDALAWERERDSWPNQAISSFVLAGGIRWHVQRAGHGPSLLLVHGTGASTHSWRDVLPLLADHFDVLALDLPGHGFSDAIAARRMSLPALAGAITALLETLAFRPIVVVGHSAGAAILAQMCITRQIEPAIVVSINGAYLPLRGPAGRLFPPAARLIARLGFWPQWVARRARRSNIVARLIRDMGSRLDAAGIDYYVRLAQSPRHVQAALDMMAGWDLSALARELPRLEQPLVLIVGDRDRAIAPADAGRVAALVQRARIVTVAASGHLAHEEQPARIARLIRDAAVSVDVAVAAEADG